MGGRNIFLPGRLFPRKFPDFSGGVEEIANPEFNHLIYLYLGNVPLVAIIMTTNMTKQVPYQWIKSQQLIWRWDVA